MTKPWMKWTLRLAAAYNILWGLFVLLFPKLPFELMNMPAPGYIAIWQCVGMIIGVYGVGYFAASFDPLRHWPITLVGLLGKIFGPIGFVYYVIEGGLPLSMGATIITNDLIWWIPFTCILLAAWKNFRTEILGFSTEKELEKILASFKTNKGRSMAEANEDKAVMLVFLRHFGCTFCREMLADLKQREYEIRESGKHLIFVHMSSESTADNYFSKYGFTNAEHISDKEQRLYKTFGLGRGSLWALFGLKSFTRGFWAGIIKGHGIGALQGDGFRMPGIFILYKNKIRKSFIHSYAAQRANYSELASCELQFSKNADFKEEQLNYEHNRN